MAEKNQKFMVRHIATGRKVPVHPSMHKDPTWLAENGYMKIESLKPFERSAISFEPLPPLPTMDAPAPVAPEPVKNKPVQSKK